MNIMEATKQALEKGAGIKKSTSENYYFLPINASTSYRVMKIDGNDDENELLCQPNWNPTAEDILNEDWELYGTPNLSERIINSEFRRISRKFRDLDWSNRYLAHRMDKYRNIVMIFCTLTAFAIMLMIGVLKLK